MENVKKKKNCGMMKRVEEVEEAGLVNKHIFWRSAGGNALEGQGYEFMTEYDTIVSMCADCRHSVSEQVGSQPTACPVRREVRRCLRTRAHGQESRGGGGCERSRRAGSKP